MNIAIDFDGTCVSHEFPEIGKDIDAIPVLKELIKSGHNLILNTMQSGKYLDEAVQWFKDNKIELYRINKNPEQESWTSSPKIYAELYIDDAALGCPLVYNMEVSILPFADWNYISKYLDERDII